MPRIHSFPPISDPKAVTLILGSMPGKISLLEREYYAHPRNAFWRIIQSIFELDSDLSYAERCSQLRYHRVAVWDVLKTCTRTSSLDSDIVDSSIIPNDFERFFSIHTQIRIVYFNGAKAEKLYTKHVLPNLPSEMAALATESLPSTSPAYASLSFESKLERCKVVAS